MKKLMKEMFKKDKMRNLIIIAGLLGIVLIYLSSLFDFGGNEGQNLQESDENAITFSIREYEQALENSLKQVVCAITGEENPVIMVTLESTGQYIYATETKKNTKSIQENSEETQGRYETGEESELTYLIIKDSSGNEHALTISEIQPKVKGVVVVSEYGDISSVQEQLVQAVRTALNLSASKIYVVPQKKK